MKHPIKILSKISKFIRSHTQILLMCAALILAIVFLSFTPADDIFGIERKLLKSLLAIFSPTLLIASLWYVWNNDLNQSNKASLQIYRFRRLGKAMLIAFGAITLTYLPLVIKNTTLPPPYNEPFAPFYFFTWPSDTILNQTWFSPAITKKIVLTYPLALFFGQYPMQYGNISPLLLAFLPLILILPIRKKVSNNLPLKFLTLTSTLGVFIWVCARPSVIAPRYILPALLALLPIGGYLAEQMWQHKNYLMLRSAVIVSLGALLLFTILTLLPNLLITDNYVLSPRKTFEGSIWRTIETVNANAAMGDRVCLFMWYRSLLRPDLLQCYTQIELVEQQPKKTIWDTLYHQEGIRWLVLDRSTHISRYGAILNPKIVPKFLSVKVYPIDSNFMAYEIIPKKEAPKPLKSCIKQSDGTWKVQQQILTPLQNDKVKK